MQQPQLEGIIRKIKGDLLVAQKEVAREKSEKEKYILLWEKTLREFDEHKVEFEA